RKAPLAGGDLRLHGRETLNERRDLGGVEHACPAEAVRVRDAAANVRLPESRVHPDAGGERLDRGVRVLAEPPAPQLAHCPLFSISLKYIRACRPKFFTVPVLSR